MFIHWKGKTAIVRRYADGRFTSSYKITIGADFILKTVQWDQKTRINIQLWDIAGNERFGAMTRIYYKNASAAFVVIDVTRSNTLHTVSKWLEDLRDKVTLNDGSDIPVILLANKSDVEGYSISSDILNRMCKDHRIDTWFLTSAKENINIDEAFNFITTKSLQHRQKEQTNVSNNVKEGIVLRRKPIFDKKFYQDRHRCCH